jgi:RND family efflux transporter MFP subunit
MLAPVMHAAQARCRLRRAVCAATPALLLTACGGAAPTVTAAPQRPPRALYLAARAVRVTPRLYAYATVEPAYTVSVNAPEAGVLRGLRVTPGATVRAGEALARLQGPALAAQLLQAEAARRSAQAELQAALKTLAVARQQLAAHLGTRQAVNQAEGALARAQGAEANATTALGTVRRLQTVTAPADGTVLTLAAGAGELVAAHQALLTLQPAGELWLVASFYGSDRGRVRAGMRGSFTPAGAGPALRVRVVRRWRTLAPGGGERVALAAEGGAPGWLSGESGRVTLRQAARTLVAVPTRALILSRGRWWVMVRGAHGDVAREVRPGAAEGWDTLIQAGLKPGEVVAVSNAYLLFHRAIATRYQLPD